MNVVVPVPEIYGVGSNVSAVSRSSSLLLYHFKIAPLFAVAVNDGITSPSHTATDVTFVGTCTEHEVTVKVTLTASLVHPFSVFVT